MVEVVLSQIDVWYKEPTAGNDRPKLLAKLAVLELCGWLEETFDDLILAIDRDCLQDPDWAQVLVSKTYGFDYQLHLRPLMVSIVGEHMMRVIESDFETAHPGDLDQLKSILGDLWKRRCSFAHADIAGNVRRQQQFAAPSWAINQLRLLRKILTRFQAVVQHRVRGLPR